MVGNGTTLGTRRRTITVDSECTRAMSRTGKDQPPDEATLFTEEEFAAAYRLVTTREEARELARMDCMPRDPDDDGPPWLLSPDVLDLLSLVSADCAERVRVVLGLTPEEAHERRLRVAERFGPDNQ